MGGLDSNDPHGLYASGTHTCGNGATTLTSAGANWTTNHWVEYMLLNMTRNENIYVCSNTSKTIMYQASNGSGDPIIFNTGDAYAIRRVLIALDQRGRGQGDLVVGDSPMNSRTGTWRGRIRR